MARATTMSELFSQPLAGKASAAGIGHHQDVGSLIDLSGKIVGWVDLDMAGEHAKAMALAVNVFDIAKSALTLAEAALTLHPGNDSTALYTVRATLKAMEL